MRSDAMDEVVIMSGDQQALMSLTVAFQGTPYEITSVEPVRTMRTATRLAARGPAAMIISLDGTENVAEIRALLATSPQTRFVFLVSQMPPGRRSAGRDASGSVILGCREAIVIVATLVALLSNDRARGGVA
jgi:hypothetical protein